MKVIIDTNFLLIPSQFKVDIFLEINRILEVKYSLCILDKTINELNKVVEKSRGKDKKAAKLALELIDHANLEIISTKTHYVDKAILEIVNKDYIVATQDKELKQKILDKGVAVIILRQKRYLQLMQP